MIDTIQIHDLSFRYADEERLVLQGVDVRISADQIVAVLGNNGSGKTTLLLMLLQRLLPQQGQILFSGENGGDGSPYRIGYLPQIEKVPFGFTIQEYILMGRFPWIERFHMPEKADQDKVHEVMEQLDILPMARKHLQDVSGGELQKVRIARMLAQEPDLFLMDEPANHLDLKNRVELLKIIKMLKDNKKIVIFTTHEPNDAVEIADQVLLMRQGHKIAFGETRRVLNQETLQKTFDIPITIQMVKQKPYILPGG